MFGLNFIQLIGLACILVGIVGGGVQVAGNKVDPFKGTWRSVLAILFGVVLVVYGPRFLEHWTRFNVDSVSVQWDSTTGDACGGSLKYTLVFETSGGEGSVKYQMVLDDNKYDAETQEVSASGSHAYSKSFLANYTASDYPSRIALQVLVLEPNRRESRSVLLPLECQETASDLVPKIDKFFVKLHDTVAKYGRSSSAVTHDFYGYELEYYSRTFHKEEDFVCFIERCGKKPLPPPSPNKPKCTFDPVKVRSVNDFNDKQVVLEASVDWQYGTKRGQTLTDYKLSRESSGQPFRITSVQQPRAGERCS